ncbi:hypothetical protein H6768_04060 [Candidatus Peribacteria bacterium]|nr:hypothetical protein [Candidatus Peribacteria bacterium]
MDTGLKPSIDTDNPQNKDSIYKTTRANIISKYDSGKRDRETIQSFLYLTSLENNTSRYQEVASEWCQKNESECI